MSDDILYSHNYQIRQVETVQKDKHSPITYKHNFQVWTTEIDHGEEFDLGPSWCQDRFPAFRAAWSIPIEFHAESYRDEFERLHKESRAKAMDWFGRNIKHCFPLDEAMGKSPLGKAFASSPDGEKFIIVSGNEATMFYQRPYLREFGSTDFIQFTVEDAKRGHCPYGVDDIIKGCVWRPIVPEKELLPR